MKLVKATLDITNGEPADMAAALLEFDDGRQVFLDADIKRSLLDRGLVYLGFEDLEPVTLSVGPESIKFPGCTKDADVIAAARRFTDHLDGRQDISPGSSLI